MLTEKEIKNMKPGDEIITFAGEISNEAILFVLDESLEYGYKHKYVTTKKGELYNSKLEIAKKKL